jgi:hypothetical protein
VIPKSNTWGMPRYAPRSDPFSENESNPPGIGSRQVYVRRRADWMDGIFDFPIAALPNPAINSRRFV